VATDSAFTALVAQGQTTALASKDFTVKVDATGLKAATAYHYRFRAYAATSPTGRTRTLPTGSVAQVKLAVFSCVNYPAGYFNVYAHAAKRGDLDATVHLGDYIYEYEERRRPAGPARRRAHDRRVGRPRNRQRHLARRCRQPPSRHRRQLQHPQGSGPSGVPRVDAHPQRAA